MSEQVPDESSYIQQCSSSVPMRSKASNTQKGNNPKKQKTKVAEEVEKSKSKLKNANKFIKKRESGKKRIKFSGLGKRRTQAPAAKKKAALKTDHSKSTKIFKGPRKNSKINPINKRSLDLTGTSTIGKVLRKPKVSDKARLKGGVCIGRGGEAPFLEKSGSKGGI